MASPAEARLAIRFDAAISRLRKSWPSLDIMDDELVGTQTATECNASTTSAVADDISHSHPSQKRVLESGSVSVLFRFMRC